MKYLLFLFIALLPTFLFGQISEWSQKPSIGVYYTPLKMEYYSFSSGLDPKARIWEKTLNLTASVPISQKFRIGVQYFSVSTSVENEPVDRSQLLGIASLRGYAISYKRWLNIFMGWGLAFDVGHRPGNSLVKGSGVLGVEYHFTK